MDLPAHRKVNRGALVARGKDGLGEQIAGARIALNVADHNVVKPQPRVGVGIIAIGMLETGLRVGNQAVGARRRSLEVEGSDAIVLSRGGNNPRTILDLGALGSGRGARLEDFNAMAAIGCGGKFLELEMTDCRSNEGDLQQERRVSRITAPMVSTPMRRSPTRAWKEDIIIVCSVDVVCDVVGIVEERRVLKASPNCCVW